MEHRSAHGPPPISAESCCDPVKSRTGYSQRRKTLRPLARCADGTAQWGVAATDRDIELSGGGRTAVHRRGDIVVRDTGPWTPAVHALLKHLEAVGFAAAPRLVGDGIDEDGRELLTFIEGDFTQPGPWTIDGAAALGRLLRDLHHATSTFVPEPAAVWFDWHGRHLGGSERVIGHCDVAPWNIVTRSGLPVGLIDWEFAGPVDPLVELAQLCWLNAKLHDDIVAELEGLPPLAERAAHLAAIADGYGLTARQRRGFLTTIIEFAISDTAAEADDARVTPEMTAHPVACWAMAWRARSAAWIIRHRPALESALERGIS